jgi:Flp pilus assembly pilin Flp
MSPTAAGELFRTVSWELYIGSKDSEQTEAMFIPQFNEMLVDERGQSLVEYALVIALVAVACIAALTLFGRKTNNQLYGQITNAMNSVP